MDTRNELFPVVPQGGGGGGGSGAVSAGVKAGLQCCGRRKERCLRELRCSLVWSAPV